MLKTPPHAVGGGVERRQTSPFLFESSDQQYAAAFGTTATGAPRITFQPASKSPLAFTEAMKRGGGIGGSGPERGGSDLAGAAANVPFEEVCRRVMGVQDAELLVGSKRMRAVGYLVLWRIARDALHSS